MTIINKIPDNSRVLFPVSRFESSALNGFGRYVWENAGNTQVNLMADLEPSHVYLIERVNFFANVAESDWLSSMISAVDFPRVALQFRPLRAGSIYGEPFRCVNYVDNAETLIYFRPQQRADVLTATMYGQVQQVPGMVGLLTLISQINYTVYEITDKSWIQTFERDPRAFGRGERF